MKFISAGQSALRIVLETGADLQAVRNENTGAEICFEKPNGVRGSFTAVILDEPKGVICYDVTDGSQLDAAGWWRFWARVRFFDGRCATGRPVRVFVYNAHL